MSSDLMTRPKDKYVTVDGLKLRYIEEGEGPTVLLLHGASLGSSADVFIRNLVPLARAGFRAIAYDQPGFGLSDVPADLSAAYRRDSTPKFMDALGLKKADGSLAFITGVKDITDTADVRVLFRNALLTQKDGEGMVVLAGPATNGCERGRCCC